MAAEPPPDPSDQTGAPAILLDVSRLVSRVGLGAATGIDRVEAAWLRHIQGRPHRLLARVPRRQLLLPPGAGAALLGWLDDPATVPRATGLVARLRRAETPRARAEEALALMAIATGSTQGRLLARPLARAFPDGGSWLAVGHANLDPGPWRALGRLDPVVMIHDTIPLDHPAFTRPDQVAVFRRRLTAALQRATLILTVSEATRADILRWRDALGITPPPGQRIAATLIGTVLVEPTPQTLPADLPLDRPVFVTLGTIEPRKNHGLLLDTWQLLAQRLPPDAMPRLVIAGRRGWMNEALFARLDALPAAGSVVELPGLDDGAVAALLGRAHALLMPSRAEGFGLPLTEAAGRGVPVIAAPTPAGRELLGSDATWLSPDAPHSWADAIASLAAGPCKRLKPLAIPSWSDHFRKVTALLTRQPESRG